MIVEKRKNTTYKKPRFSSILIPTWNNLSYLKLSIKSVRENSRLENQIIVFINENNDNTLEWIKQQEDIDYIYSSKNLGICYSLNISRSLVETDYIVYLNDDMYVCPEWDLELYKSIQEIKHPYFYFASTMISPYYVGNKCTVIKDYGTNLDNFKEKEILQEYKNLDAIDWNGAIWPPTIIHKDVWDMVGGLSIEFSPGFYSDPDISIKLWHIGIRHFKTIAGSKVYHFTSKSTKRIKPNKGRITFLLKWGITCRTFTKFYLQAKNPYSEELKQPKLTIITILINKIKVLFYAISNIIPFKL